MQENNEQVKRNKEESRKNIPGPRLQASGGLQPRTGQDRERPGRTELLSAQGCFPRTLAGPARHRSLAARGPRAPLRRPASPSSQRASGALHPRAFASPRWAGLSRPALGWAAISGQWRRLPQLGSLPRHVTSTRATPRLGAWMRSARSGATEATPAREAAARPGLLSALAGPAFAASAGFLTPGPDRGIGASHLGTSSRSAPCASSLHLGLIEAPRYREAGSYRCPATYRMATSTCHQTDVPQDCDVSEVVTPWLPRYVLPAASPGTGTPSGSYRVTETQHYTTKTGHHLSMATVRRCD